MTIDGINYSVLFHQNTKGFPVYYPSASFPIRPDQMLLNVESFLKRKGFPLNCYKVDNLSVLPTSLENYSSNINVTNLKSLYNEYRNFENGNYIIYKIKSQFNIFNDKENALMFTDNADIEIPSDDLVKYKLQ